MESLKEMVEKFFVDIDNVIQAEKEKVYNQIVAEWGNSSVTLKKWLDLYYPFIVSNKDYVKKGDLNASIFLPPRKGKLWGGEEAITRLKLAVKAEVIIIFSNTDIDVKLQYVIYKIECLKLWTCINSLVTKFSFNDFAKLLDDTYDYVMNNWDETVELLQEKTEVYKPRRDQVLYHYTREDFLSIRYEENKKDAYNKWVIEVWPTLLDKYKAQKLEEYTKSLRNISSEEYFRLVENYKKRLDKIKINKIKYRRFVDIINQLKNESV